MATYSNDGYDDDTACQIYDAEFNEQKQKGDLVLRPLVSPWKVTLVMKVVLPLH